MPFSGNAMPKEFISAVIPAAGKSIRMNVDKNKNLLRIGNKPLLAYTLDAIIGCEAIDEVIIVHRPDEKDDLLNVLSYIDSEKRIKLVCGGDTRQISAYNGLCNVDPKCTCVVIHDGARPFVTSEIIQRSIDSALHVGASCAAVLAKDTCVLAEDRMISETLERSRLYMLQTPQTFRYEIIKKAYDIALQDHFEATDDTALVKRIGKDIALIQGSYENIKITTSEDLLFAKMLLSDQ